MPQKISNLSAKPSHLFVSLYAPDEKSYLRTCKPLIKNGWKKIKETLELLPTLSCNYSIELTLAKGLNMSNTEGYSKLINIANPSYIDIKSAQESTNSQRRFSVDHIPRWSELSKFSEEICKKTGFRVKDHYKPYVIILSKN
jgi:tRNA wybutosine-synthesizing protein 1